MKLSAVRNYKGAQYPTMADYLAKKESCLLSSGLTLAVLLGMLATLLGGCAHIA